MKNLSLLNKLELKSYFVPLFFQSYLGREREKRSPLDSKILSTVLTTRMFLRNNKDIMITRTDKGNSVVALNRNI